MHIHNNQPPNRAYARRRQARAQKFRTRHESTRIIELIDVIGNRTTITNQGKLNNINHHLVQSALEKRFRRFRNPGHVNPADSSHTSLDETGTVALQLTSSTDLEQITREESCAMFGIKDELTEIHGIAPGIKAEGVTRLIYENANGIKSAWTNNPKVEKAKGLINDLEADLVAYNEHRLNLKHKANQTGLGRLFRGGEAEIRAVAAHNVHENVGRIQEGGTCLLLNGPLVEFLDLSEGSKDELGLGRWVVMTLKGQNNITTRVVCGYNPCGNDKPDSGTVYQQHRRYLINTQNSLKCPRIKFREDLIAQLSSWRAAGDRLIVCLDANENIYRKSLGKSLTSREGLNMEEVVGKFTGTQIGPTYFRGSFPIDGIWATKDVIISGACIMPIGYGIGDHRLFVVDFLTSSLIGEQLQRIVRPHARKLSTRLPGVAAAYTDRLEKNIISHKIIERIGAAHSYEEGPQLQTSLDRLDKEISDYMLNAEKKCRRIKSGIIPYSPEASKWIRRCQVYRSILKFHEGKIKNRGNLRRSARRCGISNPLRIPIDEVNAKLTACRNQLEYFRHHGQRHRYQHLQTRLQTAREKEDQETEDAILGIIQRERGRARWRNLNYAMGRPRGRSVSVIQVQQENGTVAEYQEQEDIHQAIWTNIHNKRFYLAEQAPICEGSLREDFGYNANTLAAQQVLEGNFSPNYLVDHATHRLFRAIAQTREAIQENSVSTTISHTQWKNYWEKAREETSSSRSGRHFGHYKAGASSTIISHCHSLLTSICLLNGLSLSRWAQGVSVMIEKIPGCSLIDKIRSILLIEADFNCANRIIYGSRMLQNVRNAEKMPEEIFSERNCTAEDGTLAKVLFYDVVRQSRRPAGISSVDADNCYDRISHAMASLVCQAFGVPHNTVASMLSTIQEMKFFLRTAFGDSETAAGARIEVKTQGLCQGNGAAPAGWAVISLTILQAHKSEGHGMALLCPITQLKKHVAAILYVDDTDVIHLNLEEQESILQAHDKLQESVLSWGNLLIATGGALKPPKCFFHLISFDFDNNGNWAYSNNHEREDLRIVIPLPDDSVAEIEHSPVTVSHKTLGALTCPTGDSSAALEYMKDKAHAWLEKARSAKLSRRNFWFLMQHQFWPKVGYNIAAITASADVLTECLQKVYWQLAPLGGLRSSVRREIRQLSVGFFGGGCPHPLVECTIGQLNKFVMHYGCNSIVGRELQASLEMMIIEIGMTTQILASDYKLLQDFATDCWLKSLWEKLWLFEIKVEVNNIDLDPPREGDIWLMDGLRRLGYCKSELLRLNRVRLFQEVLFLSDVFDARGTALDKQVLTRRPLQERRSKLTFPIEEPPTRDFRLWKQAMYALASSWRSRGRLRGFKSTGHRIWNWRFDERREKLLHINGNNMDVYGPSGFPGYGNRRNCWSRCQWDIPIDLQGSKLCTVKEVALGVVSIVSDVPPGKVKEKATSFWEVLREWGCTWMWETLKSTGDDSWVEEAITAGSLLAVTDGSFIKELYPDLCATAFILECSEGRGKMMGSFAEASSVANAYRGELLGLMQIHLILLAVQRAARDITGSVIIYSDCLGALGKVSSLSKGRIPSSCKHGDILKNIMLYGDELSFERDFRHIKAHQDDRIAFHKLSRPAQLNCMVDAAAKREIQCADSLQWPTQKRFPLEPTSCFIGKDKVTSNSGPLLRFWMQKRIARRIFDSCHILDPGQFDLVAWGSVSQALTEVPRLFQLWACKQIFGIAATNDLRSRWTAGLSKMCPSCRRRTETCGHILACNETGRVETLRGSIKLLDEWLGTVDTEPALHRALTRYASSRGGELMSEVCEQYPQLQHMAIDQDKIGWRRFMEGCITERAVEIQRDYLHLHGSRLSSKKWASGVVIRLLEITHGQWLYRNVVVHDATAGALVTEKKEQLQRAIEEAQMLGTQGLLEEDIYLSEVNLDDLEVTPGEKQEYWLLAIQAARKACAIKEGGEERETVGEVNEDEMSNGTGGSETESWDAG